MKEGLQVWGGTDLAGHVVHPRGGTFLFPGPISTSIPGQFNAPETSKLVATFDGFGESVHLFAYLEE